MSTIAANLRRLHEEIATIARRCGRDPETISVLAVTKTFPPSIVEGAVRAGHLLFGENRVQEAEKKIPALSTPGIRWHLIGHLQSNKANRAVELFDVIETLDSPKIVHKVAQAAEKLEKDLPVFVQVNVGRELQKNGILPEDLGAIVELVDSCTRLKLQGLMAIPPLFRDPEQVRPFFAELRCLLEELNRGREQTLDQLSMGMSHDYAVAVEEGATLLRIGTAIFGPRG